MFTPGCTESFELLKEKGSLFLLCLQRNQGISSLAWTPTQVAHCIHLSSKWHLQLCRNLLQLSHQEGVLLMIKIRINEGDEWQETIQINEHGHNPTTAPIRGQSKWLQRFRASFGQPKRNEKTQPQTPIPTTPACSLLEPAANFYLYKGAELAAGLPGLRRRWDSIAQSLCVQAKRKHASATILRTCQFHMR